MTCTQFPSWLEVSACGNEPKQRLVIYLGILRSFVLITQVCAVVAYPSKIQIPDRNNKRFYIVEIVLWLQNVHLLSGSVTMAPASHPGGCVMIGLMTAVQMKMKQGALMASIQTHGDMGDFEC